MSDAIKAVVFDMDGILLDTESMSDRTYAMAAEELGVPDIDKALEVCRGCTVPQIEAKLNSLYGSIPGFSVKRLMDRIGELFHELEVTEGIPLMKGAAEILQYLKEKGYPIALASSTDGPTVRRQLTNAGLIQYFDQIVTGDMVSHSKPDPEIYLTACRRLGVSPAVCAGVEDSLNGVRSTAAAGMYVIMVPDMVQPTEEVRPLISRICPDLLCLKEFL